MMNSSNKKEEKKDISPEEFSKWIKESGIKELVNQNKKSSDKYLAASIDALKRLK